MIPNFLKKILAGDINSLNLLVNSAFWLDVIAEHMAFMEKASAIQMTKNVKKSLKC